MPAESAPSQLIRGDESALLAYERELSRLFGSIRFAGISARNEDAQDAPIEKLFVEPALAESHHPPEAFDPPETPREGWQPPIAGTLTAALLAHPRLVILGDPGTGKSTAIQWITASLAQAVPSVLRQHLRRLGEFTAIPIILRELPPALFISGKKGADLCRDILDAWLALPLARQFTAAPGLLDRLIASGRAFFLIDGIDELPGLEARKALRDTLWWAWEHSGACRWLVTSRIVGYDEATLHERQEERSVYWMEGMSEAELNAQNPDPRPTRHLSNLWSGVSPEGGGSTDLVAVQLATRLFLAPFDEDRVARFASLWFRRMVSVEEEAEREARRFCAALAAKTDTRTLGRVPNFLTLMALIWRDRVELPDGRAKLYSQLSFAYLENIDRHRFADGPRPMPLPAEATPELREKWLAALAWHMQLRRHAADSGEGEKTEGQTASQTGLILISRTEAEAVLAAVIAQTVSSGDPATIAAAFLDYAAARSGLFLPRGAGGDGGEDYGFLHLSFQEYFAACHLRERIAGDRWLKVFAYGRGTWDDPATGVPALREYTQHRMWHETLLFLLELISVVNAERPGTLLRTLLNAEDPTEPHWPALPPPKEVTGTGPKGPTVALAEWVAGAVVDLHVTLAPDERTMLIRRCWEWELDCQGTASHFAPLGISHLAAIMCARQTATDLAFPPFVSLFQERKPKYLWLKGVRAVEALPPALLHSGLEGLLLYDFPALTHLPDWLPLPNLTDLVFYALPALVDLPSTWDFPALKNLHFDDCPSLVRLPDLSHLPELRFIRLSALPSLATPPDLDVLSRLRWLFISNCPSLAPEAIESIRAQCQHRKIDFIER